MSMSRMLTSMLGGSGGRMLGQMIGGRTGGMIGGMAGSMLGAGMGGRGRGGGGGGLGGLLGGLMGGGNDNDNAGGGSMDESSAEILVRAMCNSAKADGSVDDNEVEAIVGELGDLDKDEEAFLRGELGSPLIDPRSFASSVPGDLAQQAYAVSLTVIDLDSEAEASYLRDLAAGLNIDGNTANQIHDQLGVPTIF